MTTRQRTTANLLLGLFAVAMVVAAIVSWRSYDTTTAAATERADVTASELADAHAQLAEVTAQRDDARERLTKARDQRDTARTTATEQAAEQDGQIADLKGEVADLKARLSDAEDAATRAPRAPAPRFYEDGSWVAGEASGCAPSALCDDEYQDKVAAAHEQEVADAGAQQVDTSMLPGGSATWHGFAVGEVIVCPAGWSVSIDDGENGETWAACM